MNQPLSKNAQTIQEILNQSNAAYQVRELPDSTRTAKDAAQTIGCDVSQIVKSLIFKTKLSEKPILILASGSNLVNEATIANIIGESICKANANFVKKITGFAIGGVPPVGHKNPIKDTIIDQDLVTYGRVWAAAGTPNAVFCISSKNLVALTGGKIAQITV